ncbi:MAG: hypothetical protein ABFS32_09365 [Bacteroidota bacterium]
MMIISAGSPMKQADGYLLDLSFQSIPEYATDGYKMIFVVAYCQLFTDEVLSKNRKD